MPEILETNVKIKADASSLKKEAEESIAALEDLEQKQQELSQDTRDEIQSMVDEYNRLASQIRKFTGGNYKTGEYAEWADSMLGSLYSSIDRVKESLTNFTMDIPAEKLSQEVRDIVGRQPPVEIPAELDIDDSKAAEIDKTNTRLEGIKHKLDEIKQKWDNAFKNNSGLKTLSRFALSLAGIRTIFSLISKSMNTYLSQNDALREKLNGIYYAIGSMLAPILEWLVNLFAKIVLYVNAFLRGLGFAGIQFKSISNGAKKTQKSMEKVKTLIAGFDELNIFGKQSTDQAEDMADALKDPFADVEVNQEWIDKLYKLGEKLRPVLEWIIEKCKEIWDWIAKHKELVLAIAGILAGVLITAKIGDIISKLKLVWDVLKSIGTAIVTFFQTPLGGIVLVLAGVATAVSSFVDMWKNGWNLIGEIVKDVGLAIAAVGAIILGAPATVAAAVAGIAAVLSTLVIVIHDHWDEISSWLKNKWDDIKETAILAWEALNAVVQYYTEQLGKWLKESWENIKSWLGETWTNTKILAGEIWQNLSTTIQKIVSALGEALRKLWEGIKTTASNAWNGIKTLITNIMQGIHNFFVSSWTSIKNTVVNFTQQMGTAITNVWNGIVNTIKGCVNGIIGFINGMIRGVAGGINAVINLLNKFHVEIPSWVPGFGGRKFGFHLSTINAPQIRYLAKGGVIKDPTIAMLGEYANAGSNPEIAAPQQLIEDMIDANNGKLVGAFAQMTSQIISAINNVDMEVKIGDDTIARSAARGNNSYKTMTGKSLITV